MTRKNCGCAIAKCCNWDEGKILYCDVHASAFRMREALEKIFKIGCRDMICDEWIHARDIANEALASPEGK